MARFIDISGMKFGRLQAVRCARRGYKEFGSKGRQFPTLWECICDCGESTIAKAASLKNGGKKSCGCLKKEAEHGLTKHYLYSTWGGILTRCYNPNSISYKNYGQKGVQVYPAWRTDFLEFYNYVMITLGPRPSVKHSIDRIDPSADDYWPGRIRWADAFEQTNNATSNIRIAFHGKTQTLSQWCRELNLKYHTIRDRLCRLGWDVERALLTPAPPYNGTSTRLI